jgi:hypothetical protein
MIATPAINKTANIAPAMIPTVGFRVPPDGVGLAVLRCGSGEVGVCPGHRGIPIRLGYVEPEPVVQTSSTRGEPMLLLLLRAAQCV